MDKISRTPSIHESAEFVFDASAPSSAPVYRSRHQSRRSSRQASASPSPAPPMHHAHTSSINSGRSSPRKRDHSADDSISILDPRRFTPTLHANLVAEILNLRRELESKSSLIESLEHDLSISKLDNETAASSAASALREARDIKRQLNLIESEGAAEAAAKERDEAVVTISELKKQVERLSKSRRTAEEENARARREAEKEKEDWENARIRLERRAHVAEGRLKAVLDEIAAQHLEEQEMSDEVGPLAHDVEGSPIKPGPRPPSVASSIRPTSLMMGDEEAERLGMRFSMVNAGVALNGLSLADELDMDSEGDDIDYASIRESMSMRGLGACLGDDSSHYSGSDSETESESDTDTELAGTDETSNKSRPTSTSSFVSSKHSSLSTLRAARMISAAAQTDEEVTSIRSPSPSPSAELVALSEEMKLKHQELDAAMLENNKLQALLSEITETLAEERKDRAAKEVQMRTEREEFEKQVIIERIHREAQAAIDMEEREELENQHKQQLEILELLATETQLQLEMLAAEKLATPTTSDTRSLADLDMDENAHFDAESVLTEIVDEVIEEEESKERRLSSMSNGSVDVIISLDDDQEQEQMHEYCPVRLVSFIEDPQPQFCDKAVETCGHEVPEPPREIGANQRRKRASIVASGPPKAFTPSTVSVGSQTAPPSPPRTRTPSPVRTPVEMVDSSCQTDAPPKPQPPVIFQIPSITIHPPPQPTPPTTPKKVATRDIHCQTDLPPNTKTTSMQTEAIKLPAKFLPSAILASQPQPKAPASSVTTGTPAKSQPVDPALPVPPPKSEKRLARAALAKQVEPVKPTISIVAQQALSAPLPDVPLSLDSTPSPTSPEGPIKDFTRPPRTSSLFPGAENPSDDDDDFHDPADLSDNDFKTILSAPKPPRARHGSSAFNRGGLSRTASVRRPALHSHRVRGSGGAASRSVYGGNNPMNPPYPIPIRHSSKKLPPYEPSSRGSSPTPLHPRNGGIRRSRPSLRKSRSANQLRTDIARRNRSPPPLSVSSAAPDSPMDVPPLPTDAIFPGSFENRRNSQMISHHKHHESNHTGTASIDSSAQQTSVVDAIAQTMVGEWMWKYVRRRKSFGVSPDSPQDGGTEGGSGVRHKRWVWLAPYERAVMWSSKQPTSGTALLGKSGRKLPIQSVLDVKDDTLPPKNSGAQLFNRSILILTPARALKFTATSRERHYVWLTALSFLSHSSNSANDLLALPPPLPFEFEQINRRTNHRDSIRVTKAKGKALVETSGNVVARPPLPGNASFTTSYSYQSYALSNSESIYGGSRRNSRYGRESIISQESGAGYPHVPRHPSVAPHSRKRSNTNPRVIPRDLRSVSSGHTGGGYAASAFTGAPSVTSSGDYYSYNGSTNFGGPYGNADMTGGNNVVSSNFFDALPPTMGGTVRLEAFVDRKSKSELEDEWARSGYGNRLKRRSRQAASSKNSVNTDYYSGFGEYYGLPEDDDYYRDDPFGGF